MSDGTVQPLDLIVAAVAAYEDVDTAELALYVGGYSHCKAAVDAPFDEAQAWVEQWAAPEESHPNIPQHRWDERTAMIAARLCASCPVIVACRALTERRGELFEDSIRGGMTPKQRRWSEMDELADAAGEGR